MMKKVRSRQHENGRVRAFKVLSKGTQREYSLTVGEVKYRLDQTTISAESRGLVLVPYTGVPGPTVMIQRKEIVAPLLPALVALSCVPRTCLHLLSVIDEPTTRATRRIL
jgi:hypothetical protein